MVRTRVGYTGGTLDAPTYRRLGDHTEAVEVDYDAEVVSYEELLDAFWTGHDPRRAAFSVQYRSAIWVRTEEERAAAEASKARIEAAIGPVATAIEPMGRFWRAEDYHQKYYLRSRKAPMAELRRIFGEDRAFVDSTAAARANAMAAGCAGPAVERDVPAIGLSDVARADLRGRVR